MSSKSLSVLAFMVLCSVFFNMTIASAAQENGFEKEAQNYYQACKSSPCVAPYANDLIYSVQGNLKNRISEELKNKLADVALDQAGVWGDTILEGDYAADGNTQLDAVEVMYKHNQAIGYKITYSEKAWYTGDCQFDGENAALLNECSPGRIVESSYVSLDLSDYFSDDDTYASFHLGE